MASPLTELPPGFVLDEPVAVVTGSSALPEGFVLDTPEDADTQESFAPPGLDENVEDASLIDRISQDMETRGREMDVILADDEQTGGERLLQLLGKTVIGSAFDVAGEAASSALDVAGSVVSAVTPDFLETPIVEGSQEALEWVVGSEIGQLGVEAARSGIEEWQEFSKEHPRAARNIESVMNVGMILAPAAAAVRVGSKAPKFTRKALAGSADSESLFKQATEKFKSARQSGSAIKPDDFVDFMANYESAFAKQIDPSLHPRLVGTLNVLEKRIGDNMDIEDLMLIRRNIGDIGTSLSPDERRLGGALLDGFDEFVENLPGTPEWVKARALYSKGIKTQMIEKAILKADNVASGVENGLRIEFRKLLNNKREIRRFNKTEREAMEKVVQGDFTTNTLRKLGAFGGGEGQRRTPLTTLGGVAAGGTIGGVPGAVAAPLVGTVSQGLATNRTRRAANIVKALTSGARPEVPKRLAPTLKRSAGAVALSEAGGEEQ